jgi:hypothetical protein
VQLWFAPHTCPPQLHPIVLEQVGLFVGHTPHCPAAEPTPPLQEAEVWADGSRHAAGPLTAQHDDKPRTAFTQICGRHWQAPATQLRPDPHGGPLPQWHAPAAHVSAFPLHFDVPQRNPHSYGSARFRDVQFVLAAPCGSGHAVQEDPHEFVLREFTHFWLHRCSW